MRYHVRHMIRRDLPAVLEIDASAHQPWSKDELLKFLKKRNGIGMIVELGEKIVGFVIYELHRKSIEVHRLAIHPDWRCRDAGSELIRKMIGKLSVQRRDLMVFDVPETCLDLQLFLRSQGFLAAGIEHGWFEGGEDAYCFEYKLETATIEGPPRGEIQHHEHAD